MKFKKYIIILITLITLVVSCIVLFNSGNVIKNDEISIIPHALKNYEDTIIKEMNVSEKTDWKTVFEVPKYDENGKVAQYEIDEKESVKGYSKLIDGMNITNVLNKYNYSIEYYFDGIKNNDLTEIHSAFYNEIISNYTNKIDELSKYRLDKVENLNMKISTDENKNVIKVFYVSKTATITAVYIDYLTGNKIAKDEIVKCESGIDNSKRPMQKEINNYEPLPYLTTSNTNVDKEKICENWTYYYKYKSKLIVNHIDKNSGEILECEEKIGLESDKMITKAKDFESYRLVEKPELEEYTLTKVSQTVNYYYVHVSEGILEKHIDIITNELIEDAILHEGYEGDEYSTNAKEFENYTIVEDKIPENAKGIMTKELIEVKYYYIYNTPYTVTHILGKNGGKVTLTTVEKEGTEYSATFLENPVGEDGKKYKLDEFRKPANVTGIIGKNPVEVIFYYIPEASIKVNYIDKITNKIIDNTNILGWLGDQYETFPKVFEQYDLVEEIPNNTKGTMTEDAIEVNYYYIYKSKLIVKYIDEETNKILKIEEKNGHENEKITTNEVEIQYYKLLEKPNIEEYTLGKEIIEVVYKYRKLKFNIKVEQNIEKVILNDKENYINNKIGKLEISKEQTENDIKIYYKIKVSNDSEIDGNTELHNYIPAGYQVLDTNNIEWNINENEAILQVNNLKIGESREYILVLVNMNKSEIGTVNNKVVAEKSTNEAKFDEITLEDNQETTEFILSISTGLESHLRENLVVILIILILIILILTIFIIFRNKRKKLMEDMFE